MNGSKSARRQIRVLATSLTLVVTGALSSHAASVYVKTNEAEIRDGTRLSSAIVARAKRGAALSVVEDGRLRVKVKTSSGVVGYVARTMVQDAPISGGKGALGGFVVEDRGPSEMRSAASGRGLMEAAEQMAISEDVDPKAVESARSMERLALTISEADLEKFVREGGI